MTQEQKAKAYDEALERARKVHRNYKNLFPEDSYSEGIEEIFPELRDSEDERITRAINNMLPFIPDEAYANNEVTKEGVLSWLEKQKEPENTSASTMIPSCWEVEQKEQKPISQEDFDTAKHEALWGEQNPTDQPFEEWLDDWYQGSKEAGGNVVMSEKEFKNWSRGIRNMFEQKPAEWSEEDEAMIKSILFVLESYVSKAECEQNPALTATYPTYYKEIAWLKSLRPRWKPTENKDSKISK